MAWKVFAVEHDAYRYFFDACTNKLDLDLNYLT